MKYFFEHYLFFDAVSAGQIAASVLAAIISIVALNKDFRSKTLALQKEARMIRLVILFVTGLSILNAFISSYSSHEDKWELKNQLNKLRGDNKLLQENLTKSQLALQKSLDDKAAGITASQVNSSKRLLESADVLRDIVGGTDEIPAFQFAISSVTKMGAILNNNSTSPVYNLNVTIVNTDKLSGCKLIKAKFGNAYNKSCFDTVARDFGVIPIIMSKGAFSMELPARQYSDEVGHYVVFLMYKNRRYRLENIVKIIDHNIRQASRVIEFDNNYKDLKARIVKQPRGYDLPTVNWKNEFPIKLNRPVFGIEF